MIRYCFAILWIFSITGFQLFNLPLKKYSGYGYKYKCMQPLLANNKYPSEEKYVSQEINLDDDENNYDGSYDDDDFDADGMPLLKDPRHSATRNE